MKDRKLKLSVFAFALITLGFVSTAFSDKLGDNFGTFVGAIGGALALFVGANVGSQYVFEKNGKKEDAS